ncbi:hypothetical protein SAMD00019534_101140 [Acytostelium subglobosum LB1]|uniref:hypothetical protein n=1 Tax=Acytostelium subglobosum LB1 TaxID=1410327 RepID=UPI000644BBC2|nr:hypothetical protein SAMD00019534_101140 [Acytostelium subglobosum LB1]GAM26939.1 hypothetical protein SAMD00019534_101140 [Acytostelium subglobosum LB1]|eukprot:XP_012750207.1 hypothetical protein SAMD00019534_101140 [Acytostelium subglobosum LB1]
MSNKNSINSVFHNVVLCRLIFDHVSDIHKRSLVIKSTIKGAKLYANGNLIDMLRYNATQMFIDTFNSIDHDNCNPHPGPQPHTNTLAKEAIRYNNHEVFNHLCQYPSMHIDMNMLMDMHIGASNTLLKDICKHGNINLLQQYLKVVGITSRNHGLTTRMMKVKFVHYALFTGNAQFMRMLLQHLKITNDNDQDKEGYNQWPQLKINNKHPGIKIEVLKVLHEEFNHLLVKGQTHLWHAALIHSVKSNMADSVQYILGNLTCPDRGLSLDLIDRDRALFEDCLYQCAKAGNVKMVELILSHPGCERLLLIINYFGYIDEAADRGHETFIKYLYQHHVCNRTIKYTGKEMIIHYLGMKDDDHHHFDHDRLASSKLIVTPLAAIRNDDLASVRSMIDQIEELDVKICMRMSRAMAECITSPRPRTLNLGANAINMIKAIDKPGSNITVDMACQFIENCTLESFTKYDMQLNGIRTLSYQAAKHPARLLQSLDKFKPPNQTYLRACLIIALKKGHHDTMSLILPRIDTLGGLDTDYISKAAKLFVATGSLEDIIFMLEQHTFEPIRHNPDIYTWAVDNERVEVFEHIIKQLAVTSFDVNVDKQIQPIIKSIIHRAYMADKPHIVGIVQQHFKLDSGVTWIIPTEHMLQDMAIHNAYHSLEYHFNSMTFAAMPTTTQLETINLIMYIAYQYGTTRVIKLCIGHIKAITKATI